jgi:hypothetical protein
VSLGATEAKPRFIFGDQREREREEESGFSKSSSNTAFKISFEKEGRSMEKLIFENPLLKSTYFNT